MRVKRRIRRVLISSGAFFLGLMQVTEVKITGDGHQMPPCRRSMAMQRFGKRGANLGKVVVRVGQRDSMAEERRPPSIETQSLIHHPGRWRGADLGTLIRLGIDAERGVAVLELHDPQRFNTMGWALGEHAHACH